ncbi:NAD(+) diphosphatase [Pseudohalioglobus lutimaris]|uniref:NAD(+) diphosphatase n=1 Tax=Pseudohalioglobus lutimaris TaxID=1737061 RepID=UPI00096BA0D6|nr:NAD(+) diphosphatase [Pseudohalioglobus lutimaris]
MFRPDNSPPDSRTPSLQLVFQRGKLVSQLRSPQLCLLEEEVVGRDGWRVQRRHFLGYWHDRPCFAIEIDDRHQLDPMDYQVGSLWQILGRVEEQLFALAGRAAQLLNWERDHQFCGRCGAPMDADPAERAMRCQPCGVISYPRIAPCVIMLVTRGEELLLANNVNHPAGMYSTLAGFIEAGETAEETLIREVKEEVGLDVGRLRYFHSQSWPFPNQLMLGFFAEYRGGEIRCDPEEIADARWFHYRALPRVPPPASVAGQLIQHYVNALSNPVE